MSDIPEIALQVCEPTESHPTWLILYTQTHGGAIQLLLADQASLALAQTEALTNLELMMQEIKEYEI